MGSLQTLSVHTSPTAIITSKFGEFISPAEVALVCLQFILSFIKFCSLVIRSYGLFMDFKSRAINHGLLILYEHWQVITIQNCRVL